MRVMPYFNDHVWAKVDEYARALWDFWYGEKNKGGAAVLSDF